MVIGAGASQELRLPTGNDLKEKIAPLLNIRFDAGRGPVSGDHIIYDAIKLYLRRQDGSIGETRPYILAAWTIRDAMPQAISIDNFIEAHKTDEKIKLVGKLAIVRSILQSEKSSLLYTGENHLDSHPNFNTVSGTWLNSFLQLLTESCTVDKLSERLTSIGMIVFNYDRCIEHFLYHAFQNYYKIDQSIAAELVSKIEIYHPYGVVGYLPWQQNDGTVYFGADPQGQKLLSLANQIRTFTEGTDESSSEITSIHKMVMEAEKLIFLGFAFHSLNLQLLTPIDFSSTRSGPYKYFATAKGISESNCEIIKADIAKMKGIEPSEANLRRDIECNNLLGEYWRSLSFS